MKNFKIILTLFLCLSFLFSCKKKNPQPDGDITTGLHIKDGKYLADKCGNKVILRGVNMGSVYAVNFGLKELEEIEKTKANAVRIVLERQYENWSNGGALTPLTAAHIEPIITSCLAKGMIPVLELHDFTGSANVAADLASATQWWNSNNIKSMLQKYQKSIIINIANEPENGSASDGAYADANIAAVKSLRDGGYTCPIMIDASNWGKDHAFIVHKGKVIMDADPLHNLIFSVHAYWPTKGKFRDYSDTEIIQYISALKNTGLPIVLGELAWADVQTTKINNNNVEVAHKINYLLLMELCQENEIGYLAWWWGFYNNPGANNQLSMTSTGLHDDLNEVGRNISWDALTSIFDTARRICQ